MLNITDKKDAEDRESVYRKELEDSRSAILNVLDDQKEGAEDVENSRSAILNVLDDQRQGAEDISSSRSAILNILEDLSENKEEFERVDKIKTEFISIASHQLRTPVSALSWLTEALQFNSQNLNPKQQTYVKDLSIQAKRLIELIEDLLDFSQIELKTVGLTEKHQIETSSFINEFVKEMETYAASKKHRIILNNGITESLTIEINKKSFYNILQNILSNAIDYSPENTAVTINLEKTDSFIKVWISNKGPIIPDDEKPHIFERFYRGESARKMKQAGTGLGLYVVKEIIKEMDGKIGFESEEGKDTMFWFTIPLKTTDKK